MKLEVEKLTKAYPSPSGPLKILSDVRLSLDTGEAISVMGVSGSGKSTLLHIIGVLDTPTSGTVTLDGRNPFEGDDEAQSEFRNASIGFVFQDHCLLPQLTALENVLVPLMTGPEDAEGESRARDLLNKVGLGSRLFHRPWQLSGGEKQRVAVARALVRKPSLLLCDEPTGNLDGAAAASVAELLDSLREERAASMIVVTHSLELALRFPRRLRLENGTLTEL